MKRMALIISMALAIGANAQYTSSTTTTAVPKEVITDDSTYWTITTLSNMQYRNTTPGAYYNTYTSGGGMIVRFKFKEGGLFEFMLYVQANTYGMQNESWTHVEGTVEFLKDANGKPILRTHAKKGVYRMNKSGQASSREIPDSDLRDQHSNTYLWDRWENPEDPNNYYLLMLDLDAHPNVNVDDPKTIDPSWISKFHISKKK